MGAVQTLFWGTGWVGLEWWRRGQAWGWASLACSKLERLPWRREWQPTPVFLPGEFHGQRSLASYSPRGHKELNMTEQLRHTEQLRTVWLTVSWIPDPLFLLFECCVVSPVPESDWGKVTVEILNHWFDRMRIELYYAVTTSAFLIGPEAKSPRDLWP